MESSDLFGEGQVEELLSRPPLVQLVEDLVEFLGVGTGIAFESGADVIFMASTEMKGAQALGLAPLTTWPGNPFNFLEVVAGEGGFE